MTHNHLTIYGSSSNLPQNLEIESKNKNINVKMEDSNLSYYEKMLVVTVGGESENFYIVYHQEDDY